MAKKIHLLFFVLIFFFSFISASEDINFIAIGHAYADYGALNKSVALINNEKPDFVVLLGDSVYHGEEKYWDALTEITESIDSPVFFVPGNHEIEMQPEGQKIFEKYTQNNFYWNLSLKGVDFIFLNSVNQIYGEKENNYDITPEQVSLLKDIYRQSSNKKVVFMHHCIFYNYDNQFCNYRNFIGESIWNEEAVPIIQNSTLGVFVGDTGLNEPYFGYEESNVSYFGVGFSDNPLKIPPHFLKVTIGKGEFNVEPVPINNDLTKTKYDQRIDRTLIFILKSKIKKNLPLIFKAIFLIFLIFVSVIVYLLFIQKKKKAC